MTIEPSIMSLRKTTLDSLEHLLMLTFACHLSQYAVAVELACRNADALAALARAPGPSDAGCEPARASRVVTASVDFLSAEECLAADERSAECKAIGYTMNSLTMPVRRDLILASSVIC